MGCCSSMRVLLLLLNLYASIVNSNVAASMNPEYKRNSCVCESNKCNLVMTIKIISPKATLKYQTAITTDLIFEGECSYENDRPDIANVTSPKVMAMYWGSIHSICTELSGEDSIWNCTNAENKKASAANSKPITIFCNARCMPILYRIG